MMEIDRMSYIFGSFARRRQSQEVASGNKRRSIQQSSSQKKVVIIPQHDRSKSNPNPSSSSVKKQASSPSSISSPLNRAKSVHYNLTNNEDGNKFKCQMCQKQFIEPKVLPCFHTFCLNCLQELLESSDCSTHNWCDEDESADDGSASTSRKDSGSAGSGYISDKTNTLQSSCSTPKRIFCPTCTSPTEVPSGGVAAFPPNYLIQHRMVLATLNAQNTHLLCDLCTDEVSATARCMDCAISFCHNCEEIHLRQKSSQDHEVLTLERARRKGITRVRRQIMCVNHPHLELSLFCSSCYQVICQECASTTHKNHPCDSVSHALKTHLTALRLATEKSKAIAEQSALAANRLHATSKAIESECNQMQTEVEKFIENYIQSIEQHRKKLLEQIEETRCEKLEKISKYKANLHRRVREARDVAFFLEDLLSDGTDVEVMSFLKPVLKKIGECNSSSEKNTVPDLSVSGTLQFLPEEVVQYSHSVCPIYGVVTTRLVAPSHCTLAAEGLSNLRVGKKTEVLLETRDRHNVKLERGGEQIHAEIRYRDAGVSRFLIVDVDDRRDGTYSISFVPDVVGKLVLSVTIKGEPIRDNPFPIVVRSLKPHHGTFHCCTFCSSGGSKEANCGCDGKMPGGYKGCGHGHEGHPGRRHWSCCGNVLEHSECSRRNSHSHYQFTL